MIKMWLISNFGGLAMFGPTLLHCYHSEKYAEKYAFLLVSFGCFWIVWASAFLFPKAVRKEPGHRASLQLMHRTTQRFNPWQNHKETHHNRHNTTKSTLESSKVTVVETLRGFPGNFIVLVSPQGTPAKVSAERSSQNSSACGVGAFNVGKYEWLRASYFLFSG